VALLNNLFVLRRFKKRVWKSKRKHVGFACSPDRFIGRERLVCVCLR